MDAEVHQRFGIVGPQLDRLAEINLGLVFQIAIHQVGAEIVGGHPAVGVSGEGRLVERYDVAIHAALEHGEHRQADDERGTGEVADRSRRLREPREADREPGGGRHNDSQAGQILEVVGDEGKDETGRR